MHEENTVAKFTMLMVKPDYIVAHSSTTKIVNLTVNLI